MRIAIYHKLLVASLLIIGAFLSAVPITVEAAPFNRANWGVAGSDVECDPPSITAGQNGSRRCWPADAEGGRNSQQNWTERCETRDGRYTCYIEDDRSDGPKLQSLRYSPDENISWDPVGRTFNRNGTQENLVEDNLVGQTVQAGAEFLSRIVDGLLELVANLANILLWLVLMIMRGILGIIGLLVDYVTVEFVIEMGKYITAPESTAIRSAWTMFRDLANIGIIGGLIATAIGTIVGSGSYNASKLLARLILSALLVNFSYFIAGFVIDTSNFIARAAYENIIYQEGCEEHGECGIAARFQRTMNGGGAGNSTLEEGSFAVQVPEETEEAGGGDPRTGTSRFVFNIMSIIFIGMTMMVFFSIISFLIARFVALIFILVTSPIGIAGVAVPILKSYSDEWWKALWSQTMFAPIFFLLVGVALNIFDQLEDTIRAGDTGFLGATMNGVEGMLGTVALFIVGIGLMMTSLNVAKKMAESSERFKQLYDGAKKYITDPLGGFAMRTGLGLPAYFLGQRYPEIAARIRDGAIGNSLRRIPFVGGGLAIGLKKTVSAVNKTPVIGNIGRAMANALDRNLQKGLDKTADQKFFGQEGYASIHKAKKAREIELDLKKKDNDNKDELTGRNSDLDVAAQKKRLKDADKEQARLEALEAKGKLDQKGRDRLAELRAGKDSRKEKLDKIADYQKLRKEFGDDARRNKLGSVVAEGEKVNALRKKRDELRAQGKDLSEEDRAALEKLERLEELKNEFKFKGAVGRDRRAKARFDQELAQGKIKSINEKERYAQLDGKKGSLSQDQQNRLEELEREKHADPARFKAEGKEDELKNLKALRTLTKDEETTLQKALKKNPSDRTAAERDIVAKAQTHLTELEGEVLDEYASRQRGLNAKDTTSLRNLRVRREDAKRGGKPLTKEEAAELVRLEKLDVPPEKRLKENADEHMADFRARQLARGSMGRATEKKDGKWVAEQEFGYEDRLNSSETVDMRRAKADLNAIMAEFSPDFFAKEYDKDPKSIRKYASMLSAQEWLKIAEDKNIREDVRNEMWKARRGEWAQKVVTLQDMLTSGRYTEDSPEYQEQRLNLFNWQQKNFPNGELIKILQSNAVLATNANGEEIRGKDLIREGYRDTLLNSVSSTAFAELQSSGVLGTNAKREAAKAKRKAVDDIRDLEVAFHQVAGLDGDNDWVTNEAGTVNYDGGMRAQKAAQALLKRSEEAIKNYEDTPDRGGVSDDTYIQAVNNRRLAKMLLTPPDKGVFANAINKRKADDATRGIDAVKEDIAKRMLGYVDATGAPAMTVDQNGNKVPVEQDPAALQRTIQQITERNVDSYQKVQALKNLEERRAEEKLRQQNDPTYTDPELDALGDDDLRFALDAKAANEKASLDWFEGKNLDEAKAILNKRNWWSSATARGMTLEKLYAVVGQDGSEIGRLSENILMFGSDELIEQCMTNPQLKDVFRSPPKERQREINLARVSQNREPLKFI